MCRSKHLSGLIAFCLGLATIVFSPSLPAAPATELRVMTWNLFVGVNFSDARKESRSILTMPQVIDRLFEQVAQNDFRIRARALAREVERSRPDVICVQEAALWQRAAGRVFDPIDLGTPIVEQDFLAILVEALGRRGLTYRIAAVGENEDVRVPSLRHGRIQLTDRNAILVSDRIRVLSTTSGWFETQRTFRWLTFVFAFRRGWTSAVLEAGDRRFRVVDVHLDLDWKVKRAQARELLAAVRESELPVVVTGDFNLNPDRLGWLRRAFHRAGLRDAWRAVGKGPGGTCCQAKPLTRARSRLPARVDLILASRGDFRVRAARRLGAGQDSRERFPDGKRRWISDHGGVLGILRFKRSAAGLESSAKVHGGPPRLAGRSGP